VRERSRRRPLRAAQPPCRPSGRARGALLPCKRRFVCGPHRNVTETDFHVKSGGTRRPTSNVRHAREGVGRRRRAWAGHSGRRMPAQAGAARDTPGSRGRRSVIPWTHRRGLDRHPRRALNGNHGRPARPFTCALPGRRLSTRPTATRAAAPRRGAARTSAALSPADTRYSRTMTRKRTHRRTGPARG